MVTRSRCRHGDLRGASRCSTVSGRIGRAFIVGDFTLTSVPEPAGATLIGWAMAGRRACGGGGGSSFWLRADS